MDIIRNLNIAYVTLNLLLKSVKKISITFLCVCHYLTKRKRRWLIKEF